MYKYTSMKVWKCENMQECKYAGIQVGRAAHNIDCQVSKYFPKEFVLKMRDCLQQKSRYTSWG